MDVHRRLEDISIEKLELWEEANVRKNDVMENIADLVTSIKRNGVCSPLLVKPNNGTYAIFSGQRRFEAAKIGNVSPLPCYVFETISLKEAIMLSLSENVLREAMTKEDKSAAASKLLEQYESIKKVAEIMGVTEQTVRGYLKYEDIPQKLRDLKKLGLTGKNIEDIFIKFPNITDAIEVGTTVAQDIAKSTDKKKKRYAYGMAIRKSTPFNKPVDIKKLAAIIEQTKTIKIILSEDYHYTLSNAAFVRKITNEELATEIIEDWVDGYNKGEHGIE